MATEQLVRWCVFHLRHRVCRERCRYKRKCCIDQIFLDSDIIVMAIQEFTDLVNCAGCCRVTVNQTGIPHSDAHGNDDMVRVVEEVKRLTACFRSLFTTEKLRSLLGCRCVLRTCCMSTTLTNGALAGLEAEHPRPHQDGLRVRCARVPLSSRRPAMAALLRSAPLRPPEHSGGRLAIRWPRGNLSMNPKQRPTDVRDGLGVHTSLPKVQRALSGSSCRILGALRTAAALALLTTIIVTGPDGEEYADERAHLTGRMISGGLTAVGGHSRLGHVRAGVGCDRLKSMQGRNGHGRTAFGRCSSSLRPSKLSGWSRPE